MMRTERDVNGFAKAQETAQAGEGAFSDGSFTPGPWDYIASTEHHGPYVAGPWGGDICDCYTMSNPDQPSTRNGGISKPILFQHEMADANARLISAAPEMFEALIQAREWLRGWASAEPQLAIIEAALAKASPHV